MKTGCVISVIGAKGQGKSPWIKNIMRNCGLARKFVYDVRYEYTGEKYPKDDLDKDGKPIFTYFHNWEIFKAIVFEEEGKEGTGIDKAAVTIEEATIYGGRIADTDFKRFIFGAEHRNLLIFLAYHAVKDTPEFLIRHSNVIVLFDTGENSDAWRDDRALLKPYAALKKPVIINTSEMLKQKNI